MGWMDGWEWMYRFGQSTKFIVGDPLDIDIPDANANANRNVMH
jgi:hypothetical protein